MPHKIPDYGHPVNHYDSKAAPFFDGTPYIVQEKVDGSQLSFYVEDGGNDRDQLFMRSRGQMIQLDQPGMFAKAVETVTTLFEDGKIDSGLIYRGEFLQKPSHNRITYSRVPSGHIALFDIQDTTTGAFYSPDIIAEEAHILGMDAVGYFGTFSDVPTQAQYDEWMQIESILGGALIEGVVMKNYHTRAIDGSLLMVKYVSPAYRERTGTAAKTSEWTDLVGTIVDEFGGDARYHKAVQHLEETGVLVRGPQDIGPLMREFTADFELECKEEIKEMLWNKLRKDIMRRVSGALPDWYKQRLVGDE